MMLANFVLIIPISKKILDITGIDVMATPIQNTKLKDSELFTSPMKYGIKYFANGIAHNIGMIVAPIKIRNMFLESCLLILMSVLYPERNIKKVRPS